MNLREKLEKIARAKGLVINPHHEHKIERMESLGHCACDKDRNCPCNHIDNDIDEWGMCLCGVLATPEKLKKQDAYYGKKK